MGSNVGGSSDKLLHRFIISVDDSRSIQYAYVLPIFFIVLYKKKKGKWTWPLHKRRNGGGCSHESFIRFCRGLLNSLHPAPRTWRLFCLNYSSESGSEKSSNEELRRRNGTSVSIKMYEIVWEWRYGPRQEFFRRRGSTPAELGLQVNNSLV